MEDWIEDLFVRRAHLFLEFLNERWKRRGEVVEGLVKVLADFGIDSGRLLDLCCGNGRVLIPMAERGFEGVGVDISGAFLEDGREKARECGVSGLVTFLEGDVRDLKKVVGSGEESFDVVVNAWTSIGYYSVEDDFSIFRQARELSRDGALLIVAETMHRDFLSVKFAPRSYTEVGDLVLLEEREYDQIKSRIKTSWIFYRRKKSDLEYVDKVEFELYVYGLSELSSLLEEAGWDVTESYGSLSTREAMTAFTSLNLVAEARGN